MPGQEQVVGTAFVVDENLAAEDSGTTPLLVSQGIASVSVSGTFSATVHLQRRFITNTGFTDWVDITSYSVETEENVEIGEPMQLRLFIKTGDYTSGTIETAVITNAAGVDIAADIIAVKAETALIVADTNELQTDDVPGLIAALNDPTAATIADAVWDEAIAGHAGAGSTGEALSGASAPSAATVADAVWDEAQADHVAAGSFGVIASEIAAIPTTAMRGTDNAALASVCTEARLAELDAANLPTDIAAIPTTAMRGTDNAALASVATEARLAELDAGNLPTDVAAIPTTAMRGTDSAVLATSLVFTKAGELDVNVKSINDAGVVGDGNATPWDGE